MDNNSPLPTPLGDADPLDFEKQVELLERVRFFIQDCLDTGHDRGVIGNLMSARDDIDRLLHLARANAPQGWVLVPREPTEAMLSAAWAANVSWRSLAEAYSNEDLIDVYAAMIAAAPSPPAATEGVDPLDFDKLEEVARAATQGPWATDYRFGEASMVIADDAGRMPLATTALYPLAQNRPQTVEANARHIATFDPPTVLALIALAKGSRVTGDGR